MLITGTLTIVEGKTLLPLNSETFEPNGSERHYCSTDCLNADAPNLHGAYRLLAHNEDSQCRICDTKSALKAA